MALDFDLWVTMRSPTQLHARMVSHLLYSSGRDDTVRTDVNYGYILCIAMARALWSRKDSVDSMRNNQHIDFGIHVRERRT